MFIKQAICSHVHELEMFFNLFVIHMVAFIDSFALVTQEEVLLVLPELVSLQTLFEGQWALLNKV